MPWCFNSRRIPRNCECGLRQHEDDPKLNPLLPNGIALETNLPVRQKLQADRKELDAHTGLPNVIWCGIKLLGALGVDVAVGQ
jgi:hypothetical protein